MSNKTIEVFLRVRPTKKPFSGLCKEKLNNFLN